MYVVLVSLLGGFVSRRFVLRCYPFGGVGCLGWKECLLPCLTIFFKRLPAFMATCQSLSNKQPIRTQSEPNSKPRPLQCSQRAGRNWKSVRGGVIIQWVAAEWSVWVCGVVNERRERGKERGGEKEREEMKLADVSSTSEWE